MAWLAPRATAAPPGGGMQLWVQRYASSGNGNDIAFQVAVSPDGSKVFVTLALCRKLLAAGERILDVAPAGQVSAATGAALIGAGLLSVMGFRYSR